EELLLLVRVGLPEEAGGLVVADADAVKQVTHAAVGVGDVERLGHPVGDLPCGQEAAGGDKGLEYPFTGRGGQRYGVGPRGEPASQLPSADVSEAHCRKSGSSGGGADRRAS